MKSVASALVLAASVADLAAPVLVAPALLLAASTAARAQTVEVVRHQAVTYRDLNLATPSGMATFQGRLKVAVQAVCGPEANLRNFDETADYKACVAKASHDAQAALPDLRQQASQPSHAG